MQKKERRLKALLFYCTKSISFDFQLLSSMGDQIINSISDARNQQNNAGNNERDDGFEFSITIRVGRRKLALREIRRRSVHNVFSF